MFSIAGALQLSQGATHQPPEIIHHERPPLGFVSQVGIFFLWLLSQPPFEPLASIFKGAWLKPFLQNGALSWRMIISSAWYAHPATGQGPPLHLISTWPIPGHLQELDFRRHETAHHGHIQLENLKALKLTDFRSPDIRAATATCCSQEMPFLDTLLQAFSWKSHNTLLPSFPLISLRLGITS